MTLQSKYFRESPICNLQECVKNELTEQEDYETQNSFYSLCKSIERS